MKLPASVRGKYDNLPHNQQKIVVWLGIFLVCVGIYFFLRACYQAWFAPLNPPILPLFVRQGQNIQIPAGSALRAAMELRTVKSVSKPHLVSFPGSIEADPSAVANILPPAAGRLLSMKVKWGEYVQKNQIIAEIGSNDLAQAHADYQVATSRVQLTSNILTRAQAVFRVGGNSFQDVQQAENDYLIAKTEEKRIKERLKLLGGLDTQSAEETCSVKLLKDKHPNPTKVRSGPAGETAKNLSQSCERAIAQRPDNILKIRSPISGQVININYGTGTFINDPTSILMTVINIKKVWVTANIPENLIGYIKPGQLVDIYLPAYPEQVSHGKVGFLNAVMDPDTRTNKTRIDILNLGRELLPNMFATVQIQVPQPKKVMIPISSILMQNETTSVFVEKTPWVCERRTVQLGLEDGQEVRVLSGLKPGERIVVSGGVFINDK